MPKRFRQLRNKFRQGPIHLASRYHGPVKYRWFTACAIRWFYAFLITHFTPIGGLVFLISFASAEFVLLPGARTPAQLPPFAVLSIFVLGSSIAFFFRPKLNVTRRFPSSVTVGEEVYISYELSNNSGRPAWDIALDMLPLPKGLTMSAGHATVDCVPHGHTVSLRTSLKARQRGRYQLPATRADSLFPFHIWKWGCTGQGPRMLSVHPFFVPLQSIDMSFGLRYQPGGIALSSNVGGNMEFLSCREYRYGDSIRHLHWRSWARLGAPVIQEFREEYLCRTALILDTHRTTSVARHFRKSDPLFEAAVSLAAAAADHLARSDYLIELFAAGPQLYKFDSGRSLAYLEDILDVLSCIDPHPDEPMTDLTAAIAEERLSLSSALLILVVWNDARAHLLQMLSEAGVAVKTILVTDNKQKRPKGLPQDAIVVSQDDVRRGKCLNL